MNSQEHCSPPGQSQVLATVIEAATSLIQGWDRAFSAPISAETRLIADLGCQSLYIIMLTAQLSRRFKRSDIPFERLLLVDGRPVSDVSLGAMAEFLWAYSGPADRAENNGLGV